MLQPQALAPPPAARPLHSLSFADSDPLEAFWLSGLKPRLNAKHHAIIDSIHTHMEDEYLVVTCGQLRKCWYHNVEAAITGQGGKATWIPTIKSLLGCEFKPSLLSAPSHLVSSPHLVT